MRTLPDGLWLHFSSDPGDPFADILCIEACSSLRNLLDKQSRFAPSTTSLLVVCPLPWLLVPCQPNDPTPRWRLVKLLRHKPRDPLVLPVRDMRGLYGLKARQYDGFARSQMPQAHEYLPHGGPDGGGRRPVPRHAGPAGAGERHDELHAPAGVKGASGPGRLGLGRFAITPRWRRRG